MERNFENSTAAINAIRVRDSGIAEGGDGARIVKYEDIVVRQHRRLVLSTAIAALLAVAGVRPASAQTYSVGTSSDLTGAVTDANNNNDTSLNIVLSGDVTTPSGTVVPTGTVSSSDPVNNPPGVFITTGASTLALSGAGTVWNAGTFSSAFDVNGSAGGGLTVSNGAQLQIPDTAAPGFLSFNSGTLTITGSGSSVTTDYFTVGRGGDASVILTNGGQLTTDASRLGECCANTTAANITALVDGAGTVWNAGYFSVGGATNNVDVTVSNGAAILATNQSGIGINGVGSMQVTGAGSSFAIVDGGALYIGGYTYGGIGHGTLTISDGATVSAPTVLLGVGDPGTTGALIVNTNAILETGSLSPDVGGATVEFDDGILRATADSAPGAALISGFTPGSFTLGTGGMFLDSNGFNVTAASVMSGAGGLTKQGAGTLTLTADNTYTGGTTISAGTLQLGDGGTSGSILGDVTDNGMLAFDRSDNVSFAGAIAGSGAVEQIGTGTTILTANSTYTGGTTISSGTLQLGNGGTSGSILGDVVNNGTLVFDRSDMLGLGGAISGSGTVDQIGTGTTILTGASTYTGGTTITSGTLQLGDGGTAGSIVGNIADNGTLAFNRSDAVTFSGVVSGSGALNQIGTGTTILTANSTYTGGTTIAAGTLQLGNGGTSGGVTGDVTNNGQLVFDRSDVVTFAGVISGSGSVAQIGTGTTILNAANSYSGSTSVVAGTLAVGDTSHTNATLGTGATTVNAGATLGGYGTAAGSVTNAGTIAVANALPAFASDTNGAFTIAGNLTNQGMANVAAASGQIGNVLEVGGNYVGANGQLALNTLLNEGGAATKTDQLVVAGNASGGTVIQIHATGTGVQTIGDGIELVQVNGTSAANSFRLGNAVQSGAYQYLLYQGGAASANDWYLRSTLESPPSTPTDSNPPPSGPVTPPPPPAYRPGVVGYAMTPLLDADYGFTIMGRLNERIGDIASVGAGQPGQSSDGVWGRMGGKDSDVDASNQFSASGHVFFGQVGKDWTLARGDQAGSTHAGVMMTLGSTSSSFDDNMRSINPTLSDATGSVETHAQSLGGYWTKYLPDGTYFDGVGQFTHYYNKYSDIYGDSARQHGYGAAASGEVGKPFKLGSSDLLLEPQAQLVYQHLHLSGTSDEISPISGTSTNGLRGRVGLRLSRPNVSNDAQTNSATFYVTADVLHDFLTPNQTTVGDTPFRATAARSWYDLGAGVTMRTGRSSVLYFNVKYARNLGGEYQRSVFGQVGYRYSW